MQSMTSCHVMRAENITHPPFADGLNDFDGVFEIRLHGHEKEAELCLIQNLVLLAIAGNASTYSMLIHLVCMLHVVLYVSS